MKNLKSLRAEQGLTQQELANLVGTTQQAINGYENRGIETDFATLIKLADCLHTSVDYLLGRTELRTFLIKESDFVLTQDEIEMIRAFRRIPVDAQRHLLGLLAARSKF